MKTIAQQLLLTYRDLLSRYGLSRVTVWRKVRAGEFPAPLTISQNRIAWRVGDVEQWLEDLESPIYARGAQS